MSKYTTQVRYICESYIGLTESKEYPSVNDIIRQARPVIFDFEYPLYNPDHREELETKILKHYYTREIGFETVGLWRLKLETKIQEIMPFYNKLYESAEMMFNPLENVNYTREYNRNIGNKGTADSTGNSVNNTGTTSKFLDTPQGNIANLSDGRYLTNATITDSNSNTNDTASTMTTNNTDEGYKEHVQGKQGGDSYAKLLMEYRDTILNIDTMLINDLEPLFMGLW